MKNVLLFLLFCSCGTSTPGTNPPPGGGPDGGMITYTKVPDPNDALTLGNLAFSRDVSDKVSAVSGAAQLTPGSVPGQDWFTLPGTCPLVAPGVADVSVVYPLYEQAARAGETVPVYTSPSPAALGLYVGAQLPVQTCLCVANCDMPTGVCSFEPFQLSFQ